MSEPNSARSPPQSHSPLRLLPIASKGALPGRSSRQGARRGATGVCGLINLWAPYNRSRRFEPCPRHLPWAAAPHVRAVCCAVDAPAAKPKLAVKGDKRFEGYAIVFGVGAYAAQGPGILLVGVLHRHAH